MIVTLCTQRIRTFDDIRAFLGGSEAAEITPHDREAAFAFIERTLVRFRYHFGPSTAGKGLVRAFLAKVTGYSGAQLTRLIAQQRRRPRQEGRPGFVRVNTVHSGDRDGEKGAYIINMVDEVTQFQQLAAVRRITEQFMVPVLEALLGAFPFRVLAFHADNGSEYINHRVAAMLNKLHVEDFTKSRPRRSNDNALVESKNGNVVRRWLGHSHIPMSLAPHANAFLRDALSPFLNHHRACLFAVEVEEDNGRRRRKYPQELVMTPYEKLRSLPRSDGFLKPDITFEQLDALAHATTSLEAAQRNPTRPQGAVPTHRQGAEPRRLIGRNRPCGPGGKAAGASPRAGVSAASAPDSRMRSPPPSRPQLHRQP